MRDVELWEAVALSLNFEPDELPVYLGAYDKFGDDPFRICPPLFLERLLVTNSNCGITLGFKPVHTLKARCLVDLPEFSAWALKLNIPDMPPELVAMAETKPKAVFMTAPAHQTPDGIDSERYEPLGILIEPFVHLSLNALPDAVRKRVKEDEFISMFWDDRPDQRRNLANQHDMKHDPKCEREEKYFFALYEQVQKTESQKRELELLAPQSIIEKLAKENKLAELRNRLNRLQAAEKQPPFHITDWETLAEQPAPEPPAPPVVAETTEQRRMRWLDWYGKGERGAKQRVYERELPLNPKADRSFIGKEIEKAKKEKAEAKQPDGMFGQLVKDGKRKG